MASPGSIQNIQDSEATAKKMVEDAQKSGAEKIGKARQRAVQIIEEAEGMAKPIKERALKKANAELQKERERTLYDAKSAVKKIQSKDLGKEEVKDVVEKLVKQIFG
jgi:vacuolar-type H+-ATPase subunit H